MEYVALALWTGVLAVLWAAGLPLAAVLFPRFPDRGASFALPIALVAVSVIVYWVGRIHFGTATIVLAVLALAGSLLLVARSGVEVARSGVEMHPRRSLEPAVVFLVAFLFLVLVRAAFPFISPGGGEQFLDFGLLNAVLRAGQLPPEDPWFAGQRVRYYYGGHLSTAVLVKLTGISPPVAFNLAIATFYAMLATAAYGLASAIAAARGAPRRIAGVCGAYLVAFAGNLATPGRLLLGLLPEAPARRYGHALLDGIRADYATAFEKATQLSTFHYWRARHVIPDTPNVFPYWAFLNGDLRPHMTGPPVLVLVAALCFAYVRTPGENVRRRRLIVFGAVPPVAGYLGLVNTWSLPTAVGLVGLALLFAAPHPLGLASGTGWMPGEGRPVRRELARIGGAGAGALACGVLAVLWAAPYYLLGTASSDGVGLLPPRSDLGGLVLVHGLFLAVFAAYLLPTARSALRARERSTAAAVLAGTAGLVAAGLALGFAALALCGPFLFGGWLLLRTRDEVGFETVLLVAAVGLVLIVELAYARVWPHDPNAPRWNTVYKVYVDVWVLWGVGAGAAFAAVIARLGRAVGRGRQVRRSIPVPGLTAGPLELRARIPPRRAWPHGAAVACLVVLLVAAGTFGTITAGDRLETYGEVPVGDSTLDGTEYVQHLHADEAAAIDYLDDRPGTPTIVTAPGTPVYTWKSGPSTLTGVPTVVGWEHVAGFHGEAAYERRVEDVDAIYTGSWSERRDRLAAHGVDYVYVGPNERERYGSVGFGGLAGVEPVHRSGNVTIYAVDHDALRVRRAVDGLVRPDDATGVTAFGTAPVPGSRGRTPTGP